MPPKRADSVDPEPINDPERRLPRVWENARCRWRRSVASNAFEAADRRALGPRARDGDGAMAALRRRIARDRAPRPVATDLVDPLDAFEASGRGSFVVLAVLRVFLRVATKPGAKLRAVIHVRNRAAKRQNGRWRTLRPPRRFSKKSGNRRRVPGARKNRKQTAGPASGPGKTERKERRGRGAQKKRNQMSGARPGPGKTGRNERPGLGTGKNGTERPP